MHLVSNAYYNIEKNMHVTKAATIFIYSVKRDQLL